MRSLSRDARFTGDALSGAEKLRKRPGR